ncbi:expressed unknown protein [Seminavis robusta]|uniref:Uncharacterized protein n=1 Tax=Seminavis robusta TaxID=568900 RepID=A0A9N8EUD1_9STRA|nr:expressed unknown protein [Seminavis robusta]|eukprot:Sro1715_g293080.1 n/a (652) ;mRNA; r:12029-14186
MTKGYLFAAMALWAPTAVAYTASTSFRPLTDYQVRQQYNPQDHSGIFSGIQRVFDSMNKGSYYVEAPGGTQWDENNYNPQFMVPDNAFNAFDNNFPSQGYNYPMQQQQGYNYPMQDQLQLEQPQQQQKYEYYRKPTTAKGGYNNNNNNNNNNARSTTSSDNYYYQTQKNKKNNNRLNFYESNRAAINRDEVGVVNPRSKYVFNKNDNKNSQNQRGSKYQKNIDNRSHYNKYERGNDYRNRSNNNQSPYYRSNQSLARKASSPAPDTPSLGSQYFVKNNYSWNNNDNAKNDYSWRNKRFNQDYSWNNRQNNNQDYSWNNKKYDREYSWKDSQNYNRNGNNPYDLPYSSSPRRSLPPAPRQASQSVYALKPDSGLSVDRPKTSVDAAGNHYYSGDQQHVPRSNYMPANPEQRNQNFAPDMSMMELAAPKTRVDPAGNQYYSGYQQQQQQDFSPVSNYQAASPIVAYRQQHEERLRRSMEPNQQQPSFYRPSRKSSSYGEPEYDYQERYGRHSNTMDESSGTQYYQPRASYRPPSVNQPHSNTMDGSSGTQYFPLQPDFSANLSPGRSTYNVKDNRRHFSDPAYQSPRADVYQNSEYQYMRDPYDYYSGNRRFDYGVYQDSSRSRPGGRYASRRRNRDDDSSGWWGWLQTLGEL